MAGGTTGGGAYREFNLERLLDVNHFSLAISFYMLAKSISNILINFTWQILCFANLCKGMPGKKRVHLQQFGIIHLPNTDLTYIRNPDRNKKFHALPPLGNLHQESFSVLYFFFHPPPRGKRRWQHDTRAHICVWGGEFCQVSIFAKLVCQTVGEQFFSFCQN
jgi:hypothetical protein